MPIQHPSQFIDTHHAEILRSHAWGAEKMGQLHPEQLALIHQQGWLRLFVPPLYNGLGLSLPDALRVEEGIAWADGSTGWTVTLCSGANWFVGFLPEQTARLFFNNDVVCLAGSGRTSGVAIIKGAGYELSGQWDYATGAPHATAFTANCMIEKDGEPVLNEDGSTQVRSFVFLREEVTLIDNWQKMGMVATASKSYLVNNLYVDNSRSFLIQHAHAQLPDPVYQYPFLEFAAATLAINSGGMAMRFCDLATELLIMQTNKPTYKENIGAFVKTKIDYWLKKLQQARFNFYTAVENSWQAFVLHQQATPEQLYQVRAASYQLAKIALHSSDQLFPLCGLTAADPSQEINRVWRNLHTASQHALLNVILAVEFEEAGDVN